MAYKPSPEYEIAQSRISTLLDTIGEQLQAFETNADPEDATCVDSVITEQEKSDFIFKQYTLISAYRDRDVFDDRDAYIAKLEADLDRAKLHAKEENARWYKEYQINQQLKAALKSLTAVLSED